MTRSAPGITLMHFAGFSAFHDTALLAQVRLLVWSQRQRFLSFSSGMSRRVVERFGQSSSVLSLGTGWLNSNASRTATLTSSNGRNRTIRALVLLHCRLPMGSVVGASPFSDGLEPAPTPRVPVPAKCDAKGTLEPEIVWEGCKLTLCNCGTRRPARSWRSKARMTRRPGWGPARRFLKGKARMALIGVSWNCFSPKTLFGPQPKTVQGRPPTLHTVPRRNPNPPVRLAVRGFDSHGRGPNNRDLAGVVTAPGSSPEWSASLLGGASFKCRCT
jgi:hypothetical protein